MQMIKQEEKSREKKINFFFRNGDGKLVRMGKLTIVQICLQIDKYLLPHFHWMLCVPASQGNNKRLTLNMANGECKEKKPPKWFVYIKWKFHGNRK